MRPLVFHPGSPLSVAELAAARLDGDLRRQPRGAYVARHQPENAAVRAGLIAPLLPDHHAAVEQTAAWIHGIIDSQPERLAARRCPHAPARNVIMAGVTLRHRALEARDLITLDGLAVATLERTLYDLGSISIADPDNASARRAFCEALAVPGLAARMPEWFASATIRLRRWRTVAQLIESRESA
ncbi:hypothetical protein [Microbacterium amylolyticum]|uniref:AbiEi antitoxin C-terminal domain-containing protein n=1 Tax=Microbacterium amylolyticum TaxID=936337 RepID=A0ABS4ZE17_9MICO|nr:hypothetical protein [Microbacterium amylolyticum]MBP2435524.1 hypothetical protein [Microbacterium amylolyticum]